MVGAGQEGVRTHAAVGMAAAEVLRPVDRSGGGGLRQGPLLGAQARLQMQGEGDLAGGGVVPFPLAVELPRLAHHRGGGEPVGQTAAQPVGPGQVPGRGGGVGLGEGRPGGGDVSAVAVDHVDPLEAVPGQRQHDVVQDGEKGRGLQADGAGEAEMVLGHAEGLGGGHQHSCAPAHLQGHGLGGEGIGADGAGGSVLLGGAQGQDHAAAAGQVGLHLGPAAQLQPDLLEAAGGAQHAGGGGDRGGHGDGVGVIRVSVIRVTVIGSA